MKAPFHISDVFGVWFQKFLARRALDEIMRDNQELANLKRRFADIEKAYRTECRLRREEREYMRQSLRRKRRALHLANVALKARKDAFGDLPKESRPEKTDYIKRIDRSWKYCRADWRQRETKKRTVTVKLAPKTSNDNTNTESHSAE